MATSFGAGSLGAIETPLKDLTGAIKQILTYDIPEFRRAESLDDILGQLADPFWIRGSEPHVWRDLGDGYVAIVDADGVHRFEMPHEVVEQLMNVLRNPPVQILDPEDFRGVW